MTRTPPSPDRLSGRRPGGLCDSCRYARAVPARRARFLLCERSFADPRYSRYPRLPVRDCEGFVPARSP